MTVINWRHSPWEFRKGREEKSREEERAIRSSGSIRPKNVFAC